VRTTHIWVVRLQTVKHVYFGVLAYETVQPDVWMLKFGKNAPLRISRLLK